MQAPSYLKKICPVCGDHAIVQGKPVLGIRSSSFRCTSCGTALKVRPTKNVFWGVVVTVIALAAIGLLHWLQPQFGLPPWVWAGLNGGIGGGGMVYAFKLVAQGMVFRPATN